MRSKVMGFRPGQTAFLWVVILFFVYPLLRLVLLSIQSDHGWELGRFGEVFQDPQTWTAVRNTLWVVLGGTLLSVAIGSVLAWLRAYTDIRNKGWIHMLALMPFLIPSYINTLAWAQLAGPAGLINQFASALAAKQVILCNVYSMAGIIVVMGLTHYPLVYLLLLSALYRIPRDLEWAARSAGARTWEVAWKILFPLALPGLAAGGTLAFISSLDNFGVPAFLGIPAGISVLSTFIYEQIIGMGPAAFARAAAVSVLLGAIALIGTGMQWLLTKRPTVASTEKEDKTVRYSLGGKKVWIESGVWIFFAITSLAPLLAMIAASLIRAYGLPFYLQNLTFSHYAFILKGSESLQRAVTNSLLLAVCTALFCMITGTLLAYMRVRKASVISRIMEGAVVLPYALPGIVLGLGIILAWLEPVPGWNPGIYGTVWILLLAYVMRFMILQVRSSAASILLIGSEMEEAGSVHGAGLRARWRRILIPLLLPGILSGSFLIFILSLTELTLSSLLWSTGSETIGVMIFNLEQEGSTTNSAALSTLVVAGISAAALVNLFVKRLVRRMQSGQQFID